MDLLLNTTSSCVASTEPSSLMLLNAAPYFGVTCLASAALAIGKCIFQHKALRIQRTTLRPDSQSHEKQSSSIASVPSTWLVARPTVPSGSVRASLPALYAALPDEILLNIFKYINTTNLFDLAGVDRRWEALCYESIRVLHIRFPNQTECYTDQIASVASRARRNLFKVTMSHAAPHEPANAIRALAPATRLEKLKAYGSLNSDAIQGISNLVGLRKLHVSLDDSVTDADISSLSTLKNLQSIRLNCYNALNFPSVSQWAQWFPQLRSVNLAYAQFPANAFSFLQHLPDAYRLDLKSTNVTSQNLQHLSRFTSLTKLVLRNCSHVDDSVCVGNLQNLTKMRHLDLASCNITNASLQGLSRLTALRSLSVDQCRSLTGSFFSNATSLHQLKTLSMVQCSLDNSVRHISRFTSLKTLNLSRVSSMTSEDLKLALLPLNKLEDLNLAEVSAVNGDTLAALVNMSKLDELCLSGCTNLIGESALTHLSQFTAMLHILDISSTGLTGDALAPLSNFRHLHTLKMNRLPKLSPSTFRHLSKYLRLRVLEASHSAATLESVALMQEHGHMTSINRLDLSHSPYIDDLCLKRFSQSWTSLRQLNLGRCPAIEDEGLEWLSKMNSNISSNSLNILRIGGGFTDEGIKFLCNITSLSSLHLDGLRLVTNQGLIDTFANHTLRSLHLSCGRPLLPQERSELKTKIGNVIVY